MQNKPRLDAAMKRNLFLLTCCQAVGQSANTMMFAATGLSVITFFPDHAFATLPVTMQHLGVMLWVFPAAALMNRMGRRFGFRVGSVFGIAGATVCGTGLYYANFALMCLGGVILGYAVACLQMYRFAAVELAPLGYRAKAISWVTTGGVVAGALGPSVVNWTYETVMPIYLGTYAAMVAVHLTVFTVMGFIRFPPMRAEHPAAGSAEAEPPRPLWQIARQPRFAASVIAAMIAFGTMSFLMGASPLAIVGCGLSHDEAHLVIFLHVMGMFVPSFFTGNLINRFGLLPVMSWGTAILMAGVVAALLGLDAWNFRIALTLVGVGWNFLFIGATTIVTTCYRPSERTKAQALNDFLIFATTATASFLAGYLQDRLGWYPLNRASIGLILIAALAVLWLRLQRRRPALAAAPAQ
ncbi:MAG: MFS transporter [Proteobacteria bacterium]|nr:MFS transporter [Pseudomonadota bacterium]